MSLTVKHIIAHVCYSSLNMFCISIYTDPKGYSVLFKSNINRPLQNSYVERLNYYNSPPLPHFLPIYTTATLASVCILCKLQYLIILDNYLIIRQVLLQSVTSHISLERFPSKSGNTNTNFTNQFISCALSDRGYCTNHRPSDRLKYTNLFAVNLHLFLIISKILLVQTESVSLDNV